MSISLCMIVKDEERMLKRCLDSVKDIVDEMVIVDTGSTDATCEIAKSYGARIYHYQWDNSFANAKNYALEQAALDWILLMDADDELEKEDVPKLLDLVSKNSMTTIYYFRTLSYMGETADKSNTVSNMNVRLIKNHMGYGFFGSIHEQMTARSGNAGNVQLIDIRVYHYGYLNIPIKDKNKRQRNITIIRQELTKNPDDAFMLFNMATEYYALNDVENALEYYLKSYLDFAPQKGYSPKLIIRIVSCFDLLGKTEEMMRYIDEGLQYYPDYTDLEFLRANRLIKTEKYLAAIQSLKKCVAMGDAPASIGYISGAGSYRPLLLLSSVYQTLGDERKALLYVRLALKRNPLYKDAYCHMFRLLRAKLSEKDVCKRIDRLVQKNNGEQLLALTDAFIALNLYERAYSYAKNAVKQLNDPSLANYNMGVCLFFLGNYKRAVSCFEKARGSLIEAKAAYYCALCRIYDNELKTRPWHIRNESLDVLHCFEKLINGEVCDALADNESASEPYLAPIFSLLDILLVTKRFDWFDKARALLNLITDNSVLLRLGKLYFKRGFLAQAKKEIIRSIKVTDRIDTEGLDILKIVLKA